jgi:hypothetical protein
MWGVDDQATARCMPSQSFVSWTEPMVERAFKEKLATKERFEKASVVSKQLVIQSLHNEPLSEHIYNSHALNDSKTGEHLNG